jgi:hypothetical protein
MVARTFERSSTAERRRTKLERLVSVARRREHLAAAVLLGVIACLWFWPLLKGEQLGQSFALASVPPWNGGAQAASLPQRPPYIDAAIAFRPWAEVARGQVRDGQLPLWNPYEWAGTTLVGNMQSALFFPLTWLLLLFPFGYAWGAVAVGKVLVAGLGTYALARQLRVGRGGALVAGAVYMLSAPLMFWLQYPLGTVFAMFPWLLAATTRWLRARTAGSFAAVALALGITVLAGHPESVLIGVSAAAVYVLTVIVLERDIGPGAAPKLRAAAGWAAALLLGAAIAAAALVPFFQALDSSVTASDHSLALPTEGRPLGNLLQYVMPGIFGDAKPDVYGFPWGYFGLPALLLASLAVWRWRRRPQVLGLVAMALVAAMAVYHQPPVSWFLDHVPPWSSAYISERAYFVIALAGAAGAGAGFELLARRALPVRRALAIVGLAAVAIAIGFVLARGAGDLQAPASVKHESIALTAASLAAAAVLLVAVGRLPRLAALALTLAVAVASLLGLQGYNVTLPPDEAYPAKPRAVSALQRQPKPFRLGVVRGQSLPASATLLPDTPSIYRLEAIEGYDFPLSRRWSDFQTSVLGFSSPAFAEGRIARRPPTASALRGLRMMNVRYYLAAPGLRPPAPGFETVYRGPDGAVYRDPGALPRAYVVPQVRPLSDRRARAILARGRLDPRRAALVPAGTQATGARASGGFRAARVERLSPDHLRVRVPPGAAGWLVLANAYSPHWKAEVDGRETDPWPTNVAAMGVPVSASTRQVDFQLDRSGFWLGLAVSLVGLACAAGLAAWAWLRRRSAVP